MPEENNNLIEDEEITLESLKERVEDLEYKDDLYNQILQSSTSIPAHSPTHRYNQTALYKNGSDYRLYKWIQGSWKYSNLVYGIADDNAVEIDSATVADNDYAKFTANGLEGRSYSEVMSDLSGTAGADFSMNSKKITNVTDPSSNQDVATKKYVDDNVADLDYIVTSQDTDWLTYPYLMTYNDDNNTAVNFIDTSWSNSSYTKGYTRFSAAAGNCYGYIFLLNKTNTARTIVKWRMKFRNNSEHGNIGFGFGISNWYEDYNYTAQDRASFLWDFTQQKLYAVVSNGSNYTATEITGYSIWENWYDYKIDLDIDNTSAKFYINQSLEATITTNLPSEVRQLGVGLENINDYHDIGTAIISIKDN